jgi:hypothetical protein
VEAVALMGTALVQNEDRYDANVLVALLNAGVGNVDVAEAHLVKAREIVGADYIFVRVVDYWIAFARSDHELADTIRAELFGRARENRIGIVADIYWNKDEIADMYNIAISQRHTEFLKVLFNNEHPLIPPSDWQRMQQQARIADVKKLVI